MRVSRHRRDRIDRIEARIERLRGQASSLLEDERTAARKLGELRGVQPAGRLATRRREHSLTRCEHRLARLRSRRERLVEEEMQAILVALQEQSQRTRDRLDRELGRLAPIEQEWDRLRTAFQGLDETLTSPALEPVGERWHGDLSIPEFPVRERDGYAKPFPHGAVVF